MISSEDWNHVWTKLLPIKPAQPVTSNVIISFYCNFPRATYTQLARKIK
jgi:hypothetical protein